MNRDEAITAAEDSIAASVLQLVESIADQVVAGELVYAPVCSQCGQTKRGAA